MATEGMEEVGQRVNKLEGEVQELPGGLDAIRAAIEGGGAVQAEARRETRGAAEGPTARAKTKRKFYHDLDPLVVTVEPEEDDAEVYGAAWPLIEERRRLWREHHTKGRRCRGWCGGAHPRVGGRHAGGARADAAAGDVSADGLVAPGAAGLAEGSALRHPASASCCAGCAGSSPWGGGGSSRRRSRDG